MKFVSSFHLNFKVSSLFSYFFNLDFSFSKGMATSCCAALHLRWHRQVEPAAAPSVAIRFAGRSTARPRPSFREEVKFTLRHDKCPKAMTHFLEGHPPQKKKQGKNWNAKWKMKERSGEKGMALKQRNAGVHTFL